MRNTCRAWLIMLREELRELAPGAAISIHRVPGSFEIPVVVRELARKKKPMRLSPAA